MHEQHKTICTKSLSLYTAKNCPTITSLRTLLAWNLVFFTTPHAHARAGGYVIGAGAHLYIQRRRQGFYGNPLRINDYLLLFLDGGSSLLS